MSDLSSDDKNKKLKKKKILLISTEDEFLKCCNSVKKITKLEHDDLLYLYGFYKQATVGDCNVEKPSFFDFKGKAKYDSWVERQGINTDLAMKYYIKKVNRLLKEYNIEN